MGSPADTNAYSEQWHPDYAQPDQSYVWVPDNEQWNYDYNQGTSCCGPDAQQPQPVQHIGLFGVCTSGLPSINNVGAAQQNKTIQLNSQSPRHLRDFWAVIIDTGAAIS
eukprot:5421148-Amphidinium_carterae.1